MLNFLQQIFQCTRSSWHAVVMQQLLHSYKHSIYVTTYANNQAISVRFDAAHWLGIYPISWVKNVDDFVIDGNFFFNNSKRLLLKWYVMIFKIVNWIKWWIYLVNINWTKVMS